ncbi:MAG: DUF2520 domain-containing protein [Chloroflexota bacterium]|nr:DUF2520 domain-containing protein [Chloroflexota bacterium]MDE2960523.1 DUF2520 domain-containing protein [Chloroflexota bacterium]
MVKPEGIAIGFVGAGVLGSGLALALSAAGWRVAAIASRTQSSAERAASLIDGCAALATAEQVAEACDLVFITTPDSVIAEVSRTVRWRPGQGVAHCCGAASIELLDSAANAGAAVGAMHPFQTFAAIEGPEQAAERLKGVTFAISGTGWLAEFLPNLAESLGGHGIEIPDGMRPLYHASAVLSCGYLSTLLDAAVELWTNMGFTEEDGVRAAVPLAHATIEAIERLGPTNAVTGPVVRGDAETVSAHLESLSQHAAHLLPLYRQLTESSLPLARAKGIPESQLEQLRRTIGASD